MIIDFNAPILAIDGKTQIVAKSSPEDEGRKLTLKEVSLDALQNSIVTNGQRENLNATEKTQLASLAIKIFEADNSLELNNEQIGILIKRIGSLWDNVIVVKRALDLLDPKEGE